MQVQVVAETIGMGESIGNGYTHQEQKCLNWINLVQ